MPTSFEDPGYGNEQAVGEGIRDSGVPREQIWAAASECCIMKTRLTASSALSEQVTTALDPPIVMPRNPRQWVAGQVDASLHRLNVTYVDVA